MSLTVACPACSAKLTAKPTLAGKTVSCPKCHAPVTVPAAYVQPAPLPVAARASRPAATPPEPPGREEGFEVVDTGAASPGRAQRPYILIGLAAVAGLAVLVGGAGAAVWLANRPAEAKADAKGTPAAPPPAAEPVLTVEAMQLFNDYRHGNPAAADAKYLDKLIRVTGHVLMVEADGRGYAVGLETGPNVMVTGGALKAAVLAAVPESAREAVAGMQDFDAVTVVGTCTGRRPATGRMGGILILLADARVEKHTPKKQ